MRKLIPNFLKQLDAYLLLNAPIIWISKIHYVLFFGLLMWLFSALIGFIIPINLFESQDLGIWYFLFTILAIVALCFWIYRNVIFNIEKKFGNRHWTDEYKIFFLSFFSVFIFMSFAFPFSIIYNNRVANTVTDAELINDINILNEGEPYVVTEINHYYYRYDSIKQNNYYYINQCNTFEEYTPYFIREDSVKLNLLSYYHQSARYENRKGKYAEIGQLIQSYILVAKKYHIEFNYSASQCLKHYQNLVEKSPQTNETFIGLDGINKYDLKECIENIAEAKFRPLFLWKSEFLLFLFYSTFYISLLILMFKMVNWKQYIITIITLIILPILLFIISMLIPYDYRHRSENIFLNLVLLSFFVALFFAIKGVLDTKKFNSFSNICLQLVYLCLPFIPLLFILMLQSVFNVFYDSSFYISYPVNIYEESMAVAKEMGESIVDTEIAYYSSKEYLYLKLVYENGKHQFEIATWFSVYATTFIYMIALLPLFKNLFVKQIALPRKS